MMAWFPVLILCSIVDRTPWATDEIRIRLNNLLDTVREALLNKDLRETYMRLEGRTHHDFEWVEALRSQTFMGSSGFFTGFAGQGRVKFHYGVANPILTGIEEAYVTRKGRGWLGSSKEEMWHSRTALVLGPEHGENLEGLRYFDPRECWEVFCACVMVGGPITGAFILSYFTPTVGYGCRSGGYSIFFVISFAAATFEAIAWWQLPKPTPNSERTHPSEPPKTILGRLGHYMATLYRYDRRKLVEVTILREMEFINTTWLCYTICAQTFGSYNNCFCQASTWGGGGGYISFESSQFFKDHGILLYWAVGTALSLSCMLVGLSYVTAEWLTQSHLNTTNYANAAKGLRRTRTFKKYTLWLRTPVHLVLSISRLFWETVRGAKPGKRGRRSLVWTWHQNAGEVTPQMLEGTMVSEHKFGSSSSGHGTGEGSGVGPDDEKHIYEAGMEQEKNQQVKPTAQEIRRPSSLVRATLSRGSSGLYSSQAWGDMGGDEGMESRD